MLFIAKVLDSFVVDKAVNGARAGIIVRLVHLLPELSPPLQRQQQHNIEPVSCYVSKPAAGVSTPLQQQESFQG